MEEEEQGEFLRHDGGNEPEIIESDIEHSSSEDEFSENDKEIHENLTDADYCTRFLLSNARSLAPKITSLIDCMSELRCDFAMITETWFRGGKKLDAELSDINEATGIKIVCKNRPTKNRKGATGGGVAIAFNSERCNLKRRAVKSKHEIVCVVGKVGKIERQFAVYSIYVPPSTRAGDFAQLCEELAASIGEIQCSLKDPVIIVGGDFNNRDLSAAFESVDNMRVIRSGPTRGASTLDLIFTNSTEALMSDCAEIYPPLESKDGQVSDHRTVWTGMRFEKKKDFVWVKVSVRLRSERREEAFRQGLSQLDWSCLDHLTTDLAVAKFEDTMEQLTNDHFPLTTFRRRSNEKPWITNAMRRKSKRKKRLYRKRGRSARWRALSRELEEDIRSSKEEFVENIIADGCEGRQFYNAVRKLSGPGASNAWSVRNVFPGLEDDVICDRVIEYFSSIGGRERGRCMPPVPEVPAGLSFTKESVQERLQALKKKDSHVEGDPLPHLVRKMPELFAVPVAAIFNKASASGCWPTRWKTEHITVIPKTRNPSSLAETRNISCTALLSKVLEGALLEQLRSELIPDPNQYGGLKACGAEHLLIDVWERVLEAMDEGKDAVVLLGVDFQKAFNRMEFAVCIEQLEKLGASGGSISMIKSFLTNRKMKMKLGDASSAEVEILRGSPQGSVLGGALYCATTQSLQDETRRVTNTVVDEHARRGDDVGGVPSESPPPLPTMERPVRFFMDDSGGSGDSESEIRFWDSPERSPHRPPAEDAGGDGPKEEKDLGSFKYIDDTTLVQSVPLDKATRHITTAVTVEHLQPVALELRFLNLVTNANDIGMMINCAKTQLLCISPSNGCNTTARINTPEGPVDSVDALRLVGFVFGKDPDVSEHVSHLMEKFRINVWLLFHLREAGIKEDLLFRLYCVYIRSILEYCSPVYHSMLNKGQVEALERLQRHAARICYGTETPVRQIMRERGIQTLEERREARVDRFIQRTLGDPRFGPAWYQRRPTDEHCLRDRRVFLERATRTVRWFNSPRNFFIRRANRMGLGLQE